MRNSLQIFFLKIRIEPDENSVHFERIGGGHALIWVVAGSVEQAVQLAVMHLEKQNWVTLEPPVFCVELQDEQLLQTDKCIVQARKNGLYCEIHSWKKS
jgi:hypothetical protein